MRRFFALSAWVRLAAYIGLASMVEGFWFSLAAVLLGFVCFFTGWLEGREVHEMREVMPNRPNRP